jgi:L-asparagine transporter-like permease
MTPALAGIGSRGKPFHLAASKTNVWHTTNRGVVLSSPAANNAGVFDSTRKNKTLARAAGYPKALARVEGHAIRPTFGAFLPNRILVEPVFMT